MAKILIIDDNDQFRTMLGETLKSEGYEIFLARDGKEGVDIYRADPTDVIITDVNMPEKAGPEVIFEVQKEFPDVKIIAISGGVANSERYLDDISVFSSNVRYTFAKPLDMNEVLKAVEELVNERT